jgi:hypothetical protein
MTVTRAELSASSRTREVAIDDGVLVEMVYEVSMHGAIPLGSSPLPEPWIVRDRRATVHRLADGQILRVADGTDEDPHDPYTVLRRESSRPLLVTAIDFGGEATVTRALPIDGTDVLLSRGERMPIDEVSRLRGGSP